MNKKWYLNKESEFNDEFSEYLWKYEGYNCYGDGNWLVQQVFVETFAGDSIISVEQIRESWGMLENRIGLKSVIEKGEK